jgi:hypothetical protein
VSDSVGIGVGTLTVTPVPSISGVFRVGQTVSAVPGTWDSGVSFTYQWFSDGVAIEGATRPSFLIPPAQIGKHLGLRVTGVHSGYSPVLQGSAEAIVLPGQMKRTAPKISGVAKTGGVLRVTTSAWVRGSKIAYRWLVNGLAVNSATASSFKLARAHKGKNISVKVTQSAPGYTNASMSSLLVKVTK